MKTFFATSDVPRSAPKPTQDSVVTPNPQTKTQSFLSNFVSTIKSLLTLKPKKNKLCPAPTRAELRSECRALIFKTKNQDSSLNLAKNVIRNRLAPLPTRQMLREDIAALIALKTPLKPRQIRRISDYCASEFPEYAEPYDLCSEEYNGFIVDGIEFTQQSSVVDATPPPPDTFDEQSLVSTIKTCLSSVIVGRVGIEEYAMIGIEEYAIKLIEDITTLVLQLYRDPTPEGIALSCLVFAKLRFNDRSVFTKFTEIAVDFVNSKLKDTSSEFATQSKVSDLRSLFDKYKGLKNSYLLTKLNEIVYFAMSYCILDKIGLSFDALNYSRTEKIAMKKQYGSKLNFIETCSELLLFFCEEGFQIYQSGDIGALYHSPETYAQFGKDAHLLIRHSALLANPEPHGFTMFDFVARLSDTIRIGEQLVKQSHHLGKVEKSYISGIVFQLHTIQDNVLTHAAARKPRRCPMGVLVFGESGVGKSMITDMLFTHFGKVRNLPVGAEYCYTRTAAEAFWNGFSTSQWCVKLDDVANRNPKSAPNGDPSVLEFLQIYNNIPFSPDQAELGKKGASPFQAEFVIATTNVYHLNARNYFSHPCAVQRRTPFVISVEVRPEFCKPGSPQLDGSKCNTNQPYPDYWFWSVSEVVVGLTTDDQKDCKYKPVMRGASLKTFLTWFNRAIVEHDERQSKVVDAVEVMREVPLCPMCKLPDQCCLCCLEPQVSIEVPDVSLWNIVNVLGIIYLIIHITQILTFNVSLFFVGRRLYNGYHNLLNKWKTVKSWASAPKKAVNNVMDVIAQKCAYTSHNDEPLWREMGATVRSAMGHPMALVALAGVIATGLGFYQFSRIIYDAQSKKTRAKKSAIKKIDVKQDIEPHTVRLSEKENVKTPVPFEKERNNVWMDPEITMSKIDISVPSRCLKNNETSLITKIHENTFRAYYISQKSEKVSGVVLGIGGCVYITNAHFFKHMDYAADICFTSCNDKTGLTPNITYRVVKNKITIDEGRDLAIFEVKSLPPRKDLTKFFVPADFNAVSKGILYAFRPNTHIIDPIHMSAIRRDTRITGPNIPLSVDGFLGAVSRDTIKGDCGSALLLQTPQGPAIGGIHSLGAPGYAISTVVSYEWLIENMPEGPRIEPASADLGTEQIPIVLGPLHAKSPLRFIEEGQIAIYGSIQGFRPQAKSSVKATLGNAFFQKRGYVEKYTSPPLKGWVPKRTVALDLVNPVKTMDENVLDAAVKGFIADLLDPDTGLSAEQLDSLHVMDEFDAVNGCQGVAYVDPVKKNTSMGSPWRSKKIGYMHEIPPARGLDQPFEFDQEVRDRIKNRLTIYKTGKRTNPVFASALKDEPVTFAKKEIGKARMFSCAPVDFSVPVRQYFLSIVRLMCNNKLLFESGIGTNCQSGEWSVLYDYITQFGEDRVVAGDYKSFDKRFPTLLTKACFKVLIAVSEASGNFTEEDITVMYAMAEDVAFPVTDFFGDLVQLFGSNPSGWPLTTVINGIGNALYMRYCYIILNPEHSAKDFKKHVALMTYGDDNIMSVSRDIDWFHHTSIQATLADIDVGYTMADKKSESVPFINISETEFLKRQWIWSDDIGGYLCPLNHDSIEKMLLTCVASKTVIPEVQMTSIILSASREYFFYGKDVFESKREMFVDFINEYHLVGYMPCDLPTYDQLVEDWKRNTIALGLSCKV